MKLINNLIEIDSIPTLNNNILNAKVCRSCKQPGHSRASHSRCLNNKKNKEKNNVIFLNFKSIINLKKK